MDSFEVIEIFDDGRSSIRFTSGALAGRIVIAFPDSVVVPEPPRPLRRRPRTESPEAKAARLLRSLLTAEQRSDWVNRRKFCVPTRFGNLEFGELFNIGFWPSTGGEYRLCVVPTGKELPLPDVWTNLLFALKADPAWFFAVANWRRPPDRQWHLGPVPGFERPSRHPTQPT